MKLEKQAVYSIENGYAGRATGGLSSSANKTANNGRITTGQFMGWRCADCGAGEGFRSGGGMHSFNDPDLVERAKAGELGPAMRALLAEGIPQEWALFNESAFYLCPGCGSVIAGGVVRIDDGSGNWLVFHAAPDACGECGYELLLWDERAPMGESELASRCAERVEAGCPECGGKNVVLESRDWD